jgi:hypothetical protein
VGYSSILLFCAGVGGALFCDRAGGAIESSSTSGIRVKIIIGFAAVVFIQPRRRTSLQQFLLVFDLSAVGNDDATI